MKYGGVSPWHKNQLGCWLEQFARSICQQSPLKLNEIHYYVSRKIPSAAFVRNKWANLILHNDLMWNMKLPAAAKLWSIIFLC